jgi:putative hydrolase of the HAD superfamily
MNALPPALLLDLDDTILSDSAGTAECWHASLAAVESRLGAVTSAQVYGAIEEYRLWYWSDAERHREGRLDLDAARHHIVGVALRGLGVEEEPLAEDIGSVYSRLREEAMQPFPGAVEALRAFRERGTKLALLTNGASAAQRRKIERYGLAEFFDCIIVEGEFGCGKPDPRCFQHALQTLGARPEDAWMVGDNLEWDVRGAQALGVYAVWVDVAGAGLPENAGCRPDRIIRSLGELAEPRA